MLINDFRLGLFFISTAVLFWGLLPIALKLTSTFIDPVTLTWFRFLFAFVLSIALQYYSKKLSQFKTLSKQAWLKLVLAAGFSIANYVSFVHCLDYLAPGPSQLYFQTAPFFLAFGGAFFLREVFKPVQMMFFATLAFGLLMFFHSNIGFGQDDSSDIIWGIMIVQFSALSWSSYALVQRSLIKDISPGNILLFIYAFGLIAMLPFSDFTQFEGMKTEQWLIATFCAINTLVAYGCFAQSMKYWSTIQVGAMVALTPVLSFMFTAVLAGFSWWPDLIKADSLDVVEFLGIAIVILSVLGVQFFPRR